MYQTRDDVPTHEEPWASIIRVGLKSACARLCGYLADVSDPEEFPVAMFDKLTSAQKVVMLAIVGSALLDPAVPPPGLTAVIESTTANILHVYLQDLEVEAESNGYAEACADEGLPPYTDCRRSLLNLLAEHQEVLNLDEPLPGVFDTDSKRWAELADFVFESILYDNDFDDEKLHVDSSPEGVEFSKEAITVISEYFTATAPDPNRAELRNHLNVLEHLTGLSLDEKLVTG